MPSYTASVITISDKGSRGERLDTAGPACAEILQKAGFTISYTAIVPDEWQDITNALQESVDRDIALVITTGGTGFAPRDITPEVTEAFVERRVPGIPEAMRIKCLAKTERSMLSRSACGIKANSLILNVPGSERAARENLEAVIDSVVHGIQMLRAPGDH